MNHQQLLMPLVSLFEYLRPASPTPFINRISENDLNSRIAPTMFMVKGLQTGTQFAENACQRPDIGSLISLIP